MGKNIGEGGWWIFQSGVLPTRNGKAPRSTSASVGGKKRRESGSGQGKSSLNGNSIE